MKNVEEWDWFKTSYSSGDANNCVEVAFAPDGEAVAVRDTKDREGGYFTMSPAAWSAFIDALR